FFQKTSREILEERRFNERNRLQRRDGSKTAGTSIQTPQRGIQGNQGNRGRNRINGWIDYDAIQRDCSHYLQVYDLDLIYSWTPREYRNFLKGANLRMIDEWERIVYNAVLSGGISRSTEKR